MFDRQDIARQVLHNCDVSDAKHAGIYSVCGLALRLRDLYKWDQGLNPWEEKDAAQILDWIGTKEDLWETLADDDYELLAIQGERFDPFDTRPINAALESGAYEQAVSGGGGGIYLDIY